MKLKILLIEDDADDIELLEDALVMHGIPYEMKIMRDGSAALEYIRAREECPDVIVLDYNLPKIHGRQMISEIRSEAAFNEIPLVILTTSSLKEDMEFSYQNGASKYLIKPTTIEQIRQTIDTIVDLGMESRGRVKA